ncbi:MAG: TatD family hydrolase [Chloroflexi bacterium]|nr:TatD family hydrolase [Chloroflexota bacterium]
MLVDSHVHLDRYAAAERSLMLARARAVGVTRFLTIGIDVPSSRRAIQLAASEEGVLAAVGVHPLHCDPEPDWLALTALAGQPGVVAIGEIGLDRSVGAPDFELQIRVFRRCLDLAARLQFPVVIHQQFAIPECLSILADFRRVGDSGASSTGLLKGVCHYFQGDHDEATRWLSAGYQISVGKPVTRPENRALRQAVAALPLSTLLLETDTYPLPDRSTEPADIWTIAREVAAVKGCRLENVARTTTSSFNGLFAQND